MIADTPFYKGKCVLTGSKWKKIVFSWEEQHVISLVTDSCVLQYCSQRGNYRLRSSGIKENEKKRSLWCVASNKHILALQQCGKPTSLND